MSDSPIRSERTQILAELLMVILQITTQMRLLNSKLNMHNSDEKSESGGEKGETIVITLYFYANRDLSRILLER